MEGSLYKYWIKYDIILKKQSQCKYDTVSANIVIYQWRKVTSVTLHRRQQLPFIECLVLTVEAKAGLRLFWEPWPEQRQIEKGTFAMKHTLCVSQLEKGTSFAPKHSLLLSECVSVTQMREAPLCHKGKSGGLLLKHWISVSLYNIYLLYILTLISIDEKGIRFPTISKIDSGTYIRCAWSTS